MKKNVMLLTAIASIMMFVSCEPNEDIVKEPSKDGSIQQSISTKHGNGVDILTVEYKIWVKGKLDKSFVTIDTIKSLGTTIAESDEDDDGNTKKVPVAKDYEIYVTVK